MHYKLNPIEIVLSEGSGVPAQVQIIRTGKFSHPFYGPFEITAEMLLSFKKNFDNKVRKVDCAIDFSHNSGAEAAGWIRDLLLLNEGTELHAIVDWTPAAKEKLAGKEFRYLSADFTEDYVDNETGKSYGPTLFGAGLTNRPFVKGMKPTIELQEIQGDISMTLQEAQLEIKKLSEEKTKLEGDNKVLGEKVTTLEGEVKTMKEEKALSEKKAAFAKLLSEGKACAAQEEAYLAGDLVKFAELTTKPNLEGKGHGGEGEEGEGKKDEEKGSAMNQILALAETLVKEKKAPKMEQAVKMVLADEANKELADKYAIESVGGVQE